MPPVEDPVRLNYNLPQKSFEDGKYWVLHSQWVKPRASGMLVDLSPNSQRPATEDGVCRRLASMPGRLRRVP